MEKGFRKKPAFKKKSILNGSRMGSKRFKMSNVGKGRNEKNIAKRGGISRKIPKTPIMRKTVHKVIKGWHNGSPHTNAPTNIRKFKKFINKSTDSSTSSLPSPSSTTVIVAPQKRDEIICIDSDNDDSIQFNPITEAVNSTQKFPTPKKLPPYQSIGYESISKTDMFFEDKTAGVSADCSYNRPSKLRKKQPAPDTDDSVMIIEETIEEGEIQDESTKNVTVIAADLKGEPKRNRKPENTPKKKKGDASVIFCSEEIINLDTIDCIEAPDFIPISDGKTEQMDKRKKYESRAPRKGKRKPARAENEQVAVAPLKPANKKETSTENLIKRMVVIDGSNVAYAHSNKKQFSVKGLEICIEYFKKLGHEVKAVVPQFRMKRIMSTDQSKMESLHEQGLVILTPCKTLPGKVSASYDDRFILEIASEFDGVVVSNDSYKDLLEENEKWKNIIENRVVGYTWVNDIIIIPDDPYGRHGAKLREILHRI